MSIFYYQINFIDLNILESITFLIVNLTIFTFVIRIKLTVFKYLVYNFARYIILLFKFISKLLTVYPAQHFIFFINKYVLIKNKTKS